MIILLEKQQKELIKSENVMLKEKMTHIISKNGVVTKETEKYYYDEKGNEVRVETPYSITVNRYVDDLLTYKDTEYFDCDMENEVYTYQYDNKNNLILECKNGKKAVEYDVEARTRTSFYGDKVNKIVTYDDKNNIVKEEFNIIDNKPMCTTLYKYNESGLLSELDSNDSIEYIKYDDQNRQSEMIYTDKLDGSIYQHFVAEYDENSIRLTSDKSNTKIVYEFDNEGLLKGYRYINKGTVKHMVSYTYYKRIL